MEITLTEATEAEAPAIAELHTAVADRLTREFGRGHWSSRGFRERRPVCDAHSRLFVVRERADEVVGTLQLATKKPWAIDKSYFAPCKRPLYLTAMAVEPDSSARVSAERCSRRRSESPRAWPGDAIRLDAYDAAAGAGEFYAKCGFREVGRVTYRGTPLIYYESDALEASGQSSPGRSARA